jgi:hypothetical protein
LETGSQFSSTFEEELSLNPDVRKRVGHERASAFFASPVGDFLWCDFGQLLSVKWGLIISTHRVKL